MKNEFVSLGTNPRNKIAGIANFSATAGITASTTQTQGQRALTATVNEVSTAAVTGDVVTLPSAAAGRAVLIINNGANTIQVFPASGDAIDGGSANAAVNQAAGANLWYVAHDSTNWNRTHSPL